MNRIVPRLFARRPDSDASEDGDDDDCGPPAAKRRRVKKCNVVLEDVSQSKDFCVRYTYKEAAKRRRISAGSSASAETLEGISSMVRKGSHVSVNAKELADMFAELQALRQRDDGRFQNGNDSSANSAKPGSCAASRWCSASSIPPALRLALWRNASMR